MDSKKGFINVGLVIFVLAIIAVVGYFVIKIKKPILPTPLSPSSVVQNTQPTTTPQTKTEKISCTNEYDPVCGIDGTTYTNNCIAQEVQAPIEYKGRCNSGKVPELLIEVISPKKGDDWKIGTTQTIRWSAPAKETGLISLRLRSAFVSVTTKEGTKQMLLPPQIYGEAVQDVWTIATSTPNTGFYKWVVGTGGVKALISDANFSANVHLMPGQYRLVVEGQHQWGKPNVGLSEVFTVSP